MPPGPNRQLTLSEFCMKGLAEAAEFLVRSLSNELGLMRTMGEETIAKLQAELKEARDESR